MPRIASGTGYIHSNRHPSMAESAMLIVKEGGNSQANRQEFSGHLKTADLVASHVGKPMYKGDVPLSQYSYRFPDDSMLELTSRAHPGKPEFWESPTYLRFNKVTQGNIPDGDTSDRTIDEITRDFAKLYNLKGEHWLPIGDYMLVGKQNNKGDWAIKVVNYDGRDTVKGTMSRGKDLQIVISSALKKGNVPIRKAPRDDIQSKKQVKHPMGMAIDGQSKPKKKPRGGGGLMVSEFGKRSQYTVRANAK